MKLRKITDAIEQAAPLSLQEAYDNAGLITGHPDQEITGALLCVDASEAALDEALARGANLVLAHHPIVFHPLRSITGRSNLERVVIRAIRNDIAIYAAHTNLDRAHHGMSYMLAQKLGLQQIEILDPDTTSTGSVTGTGFGAIGELTEAAGVIEFLRTVKSALNIGCIRHSAPCREKVRRIALIAGSGGDGLEKAIEARADVLLTADVRYDRFFAAEGQILLADIGHFESEIVVISLLYEILTKKFPTFALHKSDCPYNPVNYL